MIKARAISCSRECVWLLLERIPSAFPSRTVASSIKCLNPEKMFAENINEGNGLSIIHM